VTDDDSQARARLREFDLGPLPELDLDDLIRRGHRHRRMRFVDRALAAAAVVLLVAGAVFGLTRLTGHRDPDVVAPSPTPTATAPTPPPSPAPTALGTPVVEFTGLGVDGAVGIGFAANGTDRSIWIAAAAATGNPGTLYYASPELPNPTPVAELGRYASDLAVTTTREWVANRGEDTLGTPTKPNTVQEFDTSGRLVHEYPVPGVLYVAARDDVAWALGQDSGHAVVYRLSGGDVRRLADLTGAATFGVGAHHLVVRRDGRLVAVTTDEATGRSALWAVDPDTGAHDAPTEAPFPRGQLLLAVNGDRVLVSGNLDTPASLVLVSYDAAGVHAITNCGNYPLTLTGNDGGAWLAAGQYPDVSSNVGLRQVGATSCGPSIDVGGAMPGPMVTGGWGDGVLVLTSGGQLRGIVNDPTIPASTLVPADSDQPASGICLPVAGDTVTMVIHSDTPDPRCAAVTSSQHLRVVNKTTGVITVAFGDFPPRNVGPGISTSFDDGFGTYLALGVHIVHVSTYEGGGGEIWLK
jgi:hypothetical protein